MQPLPSFWAHPMVRVALAITGLGLLAFTVMRFALGQRQPPDRCPAGMIAAGARCCGAGQTLENGRCSGPASSCAVSQDLNAEGQCVARFGVVSLPGGELFIGAADWEGQTGGERFPRTRIEPFRIDVNEVTFERYRTCASCVPLSGESGAPVVGIQAEVAEAFCQSQRGRLPSAAEWVWAAAGAAARRYAWGQSGLVCRRAAFGLILGPCAQQGQAELAGSRPDGASPEGLLDLAGNVAEWTREPGEARFAARGGSFRSTAAAELKTWAVEASGQASSPSIGFRCAYRR
ncbi:MAG TPA: SUMF1/EgtB/PvdO family nonheme iron enzyme [Polyangiaceae bacterium]|nr:SUMF1/EgtB/PvdO family nonheme iron enzyme [Polyangiaceae bacterium]